MARAMGLNAITTYTFWNVHEEEPGIYDFSDWRDVAAYVRTAREEGLDVVLRPGPYVCAEWDFGGYPAWLIADDDTLPRTRDERFLVPARAWLKRLGQELAPLQRAHGGPIVAVQIENEYGSFGSDREYMRAIRDAIADAGFDRSLFYTADNADDLPAGTLPELPCVANFGVGNATRELSKLSAFRPGGVKMVGEYWDGWFDHWAEPHNVTDPQAAERELEWMLANGYLVSLYMFHGGTNFAGMNGANYSDATVYQPTTTSYDYDAPLDEAGRPTDKYHRFRKVIAAHSKTALPAIPAVPRVQAIPPFELSEHADFRALLGTPIESEVPRHIEAYGQGYGYTLYRTTIGRACAGELRFGEVRDYAVVMIDGEVAGRLDRRNGEKSLQISAQSGAVLEILVENSGRLNFGKQFNIDRKGIIAPVTLGVEEFTGWRVYPLPMRNLDALAFSSEEIIGPAFHRGTFTLYEPVDSFLDVRAFGKGMLWVNGHNVGRFWSVGPQCTLYVPGAFLRAGDNEVVAFDLLERSVRHLEGLANPLYL
jgi:beta-galactosidase